MTDMEKDKLQDRKYISLRNLLLDPNNYRFIDDDRYKVVEKENIGDPLIQKRTRNFIAGVKNKGIEDLLKSFRANGYLEVDQIQVEPMEGGKYRVLEGNRRITALKVLQEEHKEGFDIGELDPKVFSRVPVTEVNQAREGEHEMIMALKHISGNKKWATLNQAQLLHDLIHKYEWSEEQVCESIGITKHKLKRDLRTIAFIKQYKESDFGDQFRTEMYAIFREAISSQPIKLWIGWDDSEMKGTNDENVERVFDWFSEVEEIIEEDGQEVSYTKDPIINKSGDIGTLAKFINDEAAINHMIKTRNISEAYGASKNVGYDKFKNSLAIISQQLQDASTFSKYSDDEDIEKLEQLKKEFEALLVLKGHTELIYESESTSITLLKHVQNKQLQELTLVDYKGFGATFKIDSFNRVNLFAGNNNSGKTSLLEAIYILSHLNDIKGLYHVAKRRGKFTNGVPTKWLNSFLPDKMEIKGLFDDKPMEVSISKYNDPNSEIDKNEYLSSIGLKAKCNNQEYVTDVRLFSDRDMEQYYERLVNISSISMSSPFIMLDKKIIARYYESAVENGVKDRIISFLTENIDSDIEDIEKIGEAEFLRFLVKHKKFATPKDLTEFGDGVQRIFFIALMIASSQNGLLCIDEIENAIHHNLLVKFTTFLQKLAEEFHVQLFISTHSNECIKAFFDNGHKNEDITGFRMTRKDGEVKVSKAVGTQLQRQIEQFSLDLRG